MILESLQRIKKAEIEAKKGIENAKREAVSAIERAKKEAERLLAERMRNDQGQAEKMREDAGQEARKECQNIANEWKVKIKDLRKEARRNQEKAKDFILRSLLG